MEKASLLGVKCLTGDDTMDQAGEGIVAVLHLLGKLIDQRSIAGLDGSP